MVREKTKNKATDFFPLVFYGVFYWKTDGERAVFSVLDKVMWKCRCCFDKKVGVGSCHFLEIRNAGARLARNVKRLRERAHREYGVVGVSAFGESQKAGFDLVHQQKKN